MGWERLPAVRKVCSHIFQVVVSHILDAEDVEVGILRYAILDARVHTLRKLFAFFRGLGEVHNLCTLGFRHCKDGIEDWFLGLSAERRRRF